MRARNLKPGLFKNEKLGSADPHITILFAGLWCSADREGRLEDRPLRLCAEVFPYRRAITAKKVDTWLDWLQTNGFVTRYQVGEERFIQVQEFLTHQNPHRDERMSTIPALSAVSHSASTVNAPCDLDKSTDVARLNPESGILNPESSLRETRARNGAAHRSEGNGSLTHAHAFADAHETWLQCKAAYPAGLWEGPKEILAERAISRLLDDGTKAEQLVDAAAKYCAQQRGLGKLGTEFIRGPEKFYGEGHWRGPFKSAETPAPKRMRTAHEIAAAYPEDAA